VAGNTAVVSDDVGVVDLEIDWCNGSVKGLSSWVSQKHSHSKLLLWTPDAKVPASADLLQGVKIDDLVTVCGLPPQMKWMVSPTEALTAKGEYRRMLKKSQNQH
jgi:hypothetical protein